MIEFKMPSLGADMEDGTLREWNVKPGDTVKRGDIIAVVETLKGLIEIEVFDEGKIAELLIKEEDKVPVGTVMALIEPFENKAEIKKNVNTEIETSYAKPKQNIPEKTISVAHGIKASPLAKRIASENNVELSKIKGTGEGGAITRADVEKITTESSKKGKEKQVATLENIRMAISAAMSKSNREIPHYYLEIKIDMRTALEWLSEANKQRTVKDRLLPIVLLIKAVAKSLIEVPQLNASWENGLIQKNEINIGFVVSLRNGGVMVPAIHYANKMSVDEIMQKLNDLIPRARNQKLRSSELSDSTITITNLGEGGAEKVFGVIYPPQVAIIGFGSISEQPWAEEKMLAVRPVLTATLAGDHRATDGHTGSLFLAALKTHLQNPKEL